jgi:hypothetical protein
MKKRMTFFQSEKKYRFPPLVEKTILPVTAGVMFLALHGVAQATAMDSFGSYIYAGATGPMAKGISTIVLVLGSVGLHKTEGRAHTMIAGSMSAAGGVLAAPTLVTEAQHMLGAVITLSPALLSHVSHLASFLH